jgi:hypothetical protein
MKEYGTNVQKLVNYLLSVTDRDRRTKYAYLLTELMRQVHPNMRDGQDYTTKLWDDLYIMSGFKLDVDSPFPPPPIDAVGKQPKQVAYNTHNLKYRHYGRNVELLVARAIAAETEEERLITTAYTCRLMRSFYQTWNKDVVDDAVIYAQMIDLSRGKLADTLEQVKAEGLMDSNVRFNKGPQNVSRNVFAKSNNNNNRNRQNNNSNNNRQNNNNNNNNRNYKKG